MDVARHQIEGGWLLEEREVDLFGKVQVYFIVGTDYEVHRFPDGWRARLATHGRAKRANKSPIYGSAPEVVRYLAKYGKIRRDQRP